MSATLDEWQQRLASHFDDVTLKKLYLPHEPVTFALEHGLDGSLRNALRKAIRRAVNRQALTEDHFLCWTTYASEIGYGYAGDEYWHTFEQQTPNWDQRNRPFIKSCFQKFSNEYNGAEPRGAWAQHFSIICWPITHAILPNDLQRQLAQILYRIRHSVVADEMDSPSQLGQLIELHSLGTTTRFQQLAGEKELIGQIASALLKDDRSGEWIEPKTLARITADLSVEEQARSWLTDAKRHVRRQARVKGLRRPHGSGKTKPAHDATKPQPHVRPFLTLQPENVGVWRLMIVAPNLNPLVRYYPELQPLLLRASLRFGNHGRRYPARALLHSSQSYRQSVWPSPGIPLISFEPSSDDLDALLAHTCSFSEGPWLFRLGVDGVGREIRSSRVSPGAEYIVVENAGLSLPKLGDQIDVGCGEVVARKFTVTSLDEIDEYLSAWGLEAARQVVARPCGLIPASWDREGCAEWLANEQPIVQLFANYAISHFEVSIDTGSSVLTLESKPSAQNSSFLVLPQLSAGLYRLRIIAHPINASYPAEEGEMEVAIRDVSASTTSGVALLVTQEPPTATLEALFDGTVKVQIIGPKSRTVTISLSLVKKGSVDSLFSVNDLRLPLPADERDFSNLIEMLLQKHEDIMGAYAEADRCELIFDGKDLGVFQHQYDRPFTPLRWGLSRQKHGYAIALYDDVAVPELIEINRFDFSTPLVARKLRSKDLSKAANGRALPGLYFAQTPDFFAAAIVPVKSFEELKSIKPRFARQKRTPESIRMFLSIIDKWTTADARGDLYGRFAWRATVLLLIQQVVGIVSGSAWYKAERAYEKHRNLTVLSKKIRFKNFGAGWSRLLIEAVDDVFDAQMNKRVSRLSRITQEPDYLCEFALRLASDPSSIEGRSSAHYNSHITAILRRSELTRAARFLVLGTTARLEAAQKFPGHTAYLGWQWN